MEGRTFFIQYIEINTTKIIFCNERHQFWYLASHLILGLSKIEKEDQELL